MRFLLLLIGIVLGVAGTILYGMFVATPPVPAPRPVIADAPMTVTLDERFLTALVQRAVAEGAVQAPGVDVPRAQVDARLGDGVVIVRANVEVLGQSTKGTMTLRPRLDAGRLRFEVMETNLGAIELPAIDQLLETQVNARVGSLLDGLPVTVTSAGIDPARGLVVTTHIDLDRLDGTAAAPAAAPTAPQAADPWANAKAAPEAAARRADQPRRDTTAAPAPTPGAAPPGTAPQVDHWSNAKATPATEPAAPATEPVPVDPPAAP